MAIKQLYLTGFSHHLCGSAPRACAKQLGDSSSKLGGLCRLAGRFFPEKLLAGSSKNRDRIFSTPVVFRAFLSQVLTRNASCRDALSSVQAWRAAQRKTLPGNNTSAYCQARNNLPVTVLRAIFAAVGQWIDRRCEGRIPMLNNRIVRVIDGTGISMPDSDANRKKWPYAGNQKRGCGFPTIKLVGLFCLRTGRMIKFTFESWKQSERTLARRLVGWIKKGEVLLADEGFCGWPFIALLQRKGVDVVMRLHHSRKDGPGKRTWLKPQRPESWGKTLWREMPAQLCVRIIEFRVRVKGFRPKRIRLCTTLLDTELYPDEVLIELYLRRWKIELWYRDIKVSLGLDVVRCKTPAMVEKEIWMQAIAYNLVRALMLEAAMTHGVALERLSFKGTVSRMREWAGQMNEGRLRITKIMLGELLLAVASDQVPLRPWRVEPRVVKRRRKDYPLMTRPRHQIATSKPRRKK